METVSRKQVPPCRARGKGLGCKASAPSWRCARVNEHPRTPDQEGSRDREQHPGGQPSLCGSNLTDEQVHQWLLDAHSGEVKKNGP